MGFELCLSAVNLIYLRDALGLEFYTEYRFKKARNHLPNKSGLQGLITDASHVFLIFLLFFA